jgi:PAS domain S-box-containing protein
MEDEKKNKEQLLKELAELRKKLSLFQTIYERAPFSIAITNFEGKALMQNRKALEILGWTREEFENLELQMLYSENGVRDALIGRLHREGDFNSEITYLKKDGSTINAIGNMSKVEIDGIEHILSYAEDITERKLAEEAVRIHQERFEIFFNCASDAIFVHPLQEVGFASFLEVNDIACQLYGYSKEEFLLLSALDITIQSVAKAQAATASRKKLLDEGQMIFEAVHVKKSGAMFPVEINSNIVVQNGQSMILSVVRDITDRKRMEEELIKNQKLESLGVLAGGIAHDFNNILTGIIGNISLAKFRSPAGSEISERLTDAENAAVRAQDLTQQLLTFARGGAPIRKTVKLSEILRESVNLSLHGSTCKCAFSISDDLWATDIDAGQINQVVGNLVINAEQAMPKGGIIRVAVKNIETDKNHINSIDAGKWVMFSISDNGLGIEKDILTKIFDPYFSTKSMGSGLGLSICHSIVKQHGGHIRVESEPRVGSTFSVYLPASVKTADAAIEKASFTLKGEGRILLMDDEDIVVQATGRLLEHCGYEISTASHGEEAIELYRKAKDSGKPFGVTILDLTIPGGMGGEATIKRLLEIDPNIKAIVSSGYANDPLMAKFENFGFRGVISKPYKIDDLVELLNNLLKKAP